MLSTTCVNILAGSRKMFGQLKSRKEKKLPVASTFTSDDVGEYSGRDYPLDWPFWFPSCRTEHTMLFLFFLLPPRFTNSKKVSNLSWPGVPPSSIRSQWRFHQVPFPKCVILWSEAVQICISSLVQIGVAQIQGKGVPQETTWWQNVQDKVNLLHLEFRIILWPKQDKQVCSNKITTP